MTEVASSPPADPAVLVRIHDGIGRLTLNRPGTINALTHEMVQLLSVALDRLAHDHEVTAVLIDGAGDRGLCAGGDIRAIYDDARSGGRESLEFWRDEYRLNSAVAHFPKPLVAVMDGVVMGGGVGISAHASHRIVTDRSKVAMPEVNIGLVPDVGGTLLLAASPGWLGLHAALTGTRLAAGDVMALGMTDHYIEHQKLTDLLGAIAAHGVESAIRSLESPPPPSTLVAQRDWIDHCYDSDSAQQIVDNLRRVGMPGATAAAEAICAACPTSVLVALQAIRGLRGSGATLEQALNQEFSMVGAAIRSPDLVEGIRAAVIDKDRQPKWSAGRFAEVSVDTVAEFFRSAGDPPFPGLVRPYPSDLQGVTR
ncbi:3-hydroxyisobutyryl-CoA hydrolase [Nakamurella sp. PAMC28650]|uniref:3-hydroxyisobutyryl-CoA hydrolase n=1 Tax=Nakamurella sp. PAMC28650 TaxID=2762325 RepID=UPI00164DADD6|nr:3-hydroxyisobutyryl-CoA hydrolase [Nakamurella sp. PAMC28650]QNK80203.1 enoyl-CoA hydratase/isomerase family protein [Nakamurella sp. PAMC28650]